MFHKSQSALGRIAVELRRDGEFNHVIGAQAQVGGLEIEQAAGEETGGGEQDRSEGHLANDERFAQAHARNAMGDAASQILEMTLQIGPCRTKGRKQSKQEGSKQGKSKSEGQNAAVKLLFQS